MEDVKQLDAQSNEPNQEEVKLTKAEYDELLKAKQSWKSSSSENQRLHHIAEVAKDRSNFYKVYRSDKKMAESVAKHFGFDTADSLKEYIDGEGGEKTTQGIDKEALKEELKQELAQERAEKRLDKFLSTNSIERTSKFGKEFMDEFEDLMEGKRRTPESVQKYAEKALREVKQTSKFAEEYEKASSSLKGAGVVGTDRIQTAPKWATFANGRAKSIFDHFGVKK